MQTYKYWDYACFLDVKPILYVYTLGNICFDVRIYRYIHLILIDQVYLTEKVFIFECYKFWWLVKGCGNAAI
jgi:hypothetical protein